MYAHHLSEKWCPKMPQESGQALSLLKDLVHPFSGLWLLSRDLRSWPSNLQQACLARKRTRLSPCIIFYLIILLVQCDWRSPHFFPDFHRLQRVTKMAPYANHLEKEGAERTGVVSESTLRASLKNRRVTETPPKAKHARTRASTSM